MAFSITGFAIRWLARGLSLAAAGLLLFFAVGEGMHVSHFSGRELALFAFFPMGVCLGMIMAWRWEITGGSVTVASLAGFYLIHWLTSSRMPGGWAFLAVASPGFLFVLSGLINYRRDRRVE